MSEKRSFEKIYQEPGAAIWTLPEPPRILKQLVEDGTIRPCKTLDIACGEGTAAIYLAGKKFAVTGIDFIDKAIEYARINAAEKGVTVDFRVMDAMNLSGLGNEKFDFIFEWAIIHHLPLEQTARYISQIPALLNPGSLYLTNSFNIDSDLYGQKGERVRKTPKGTELAYHSQKEIRDLLTPHFDILHEEIMPLEGKGGISQPGNFFLARKKS